MVLLLGRRPAPRAPGRMMQRGQSRTGDCCRNTARTVQLGQWTRWSFHGCFVPPAPPRTLPFDTRNESVSFTDPRMRQSGWMWNHNARARTPPGRVALCARLQSQMGILREQRDTTAYFSAEQGGGGPCVAVRPPASSVFYAVPFGTDPLRAKLPRDLLSRLRAAAEVALA